MQLSQRLCLAVQYLGLFRIHHIFIYSIRSVVLQLSNDNKRNPWKRIIHFFFAKHSKNIGKMSDVKGDTWSNTEQLQQRDLSEMVNYWYWIQKHMIKFDDCFQVNNLELANATKPTNGDAGKNNASADPAAEDADTVKYAMSPHTFFQISAIMCIESFHIFEILALPTIVYSAKLSDVDWLNRNKTLRCNGAILIHHCIR